MSFVNLLANDIWSDADITRRTEAMVHSVTPAFEETILTRKVMAASMGQWTMTETDQAELAAYTQACTDAHAAGLAARADMALLQSVLDYETAVERLTCDPVTEPLTVEEIIDGSAYEVPNPAIAQDAAERTEAQAAVSGAAQDALTLYALRHPPEPTPEPEIAA